MRGRGRRAVVELSDRLALLPFLCAEFGYEEMGALLRKLTGVRADFDFERGSGYAQALDAAEPALPPRVERARLREYDANIARLSERLRMTADQGRVWKPHQYLALLFMERFLDRYFSDAEAFCRDLNAEKRRRRGARLADYHPQDLRLIALQSATGSGKTLLMHANLLQYQFYLRLAGGRLNNIILLTPNEQMSEQHERELAASGILARRLSPRAPSGLGRPVEILDINKLADKMGVKRVAVSDFGDDNLVLVDEGHLGASGKIWRQRREELARGGFTIEYSATFNQVVRNDERLRDLYAKSLLFDYGYRQFHADGYGKDYTISNLPRGMEDANSDAYLLGCLLTFYQQCRLWRDKGADWRDLNLARPLWVFLGKTVRGPAKVDREARSDVIRILDFLGWVSARGDLVRPLLAGLLRGDSGLRAGDGRSDYFAGRFEHLAGKDPDTLYADICETLFHGAGRLRVVYLTTGDGELHLRIGGNDPFGVVNVGDSAALYKSLSERANPDFDLERNPGFAAPLFRSVDRPDSTVNVVVGARRFIAGWNSWRVSTMGLMHVGVGEGPEIIQMFGRGVRLKGWRWSLKRHRESGAPRPDDPYGLPELETLHIFGLRSNYMEAFRRILQEEGVAFESVPLPVTWNFARKPALKMIRLAPDAHYELSEERPRLPGPGESGRPFVELDLYSQPQSTRSAGAVLGGTPESPERNSVRLAPGYAGFFDRNRLYEGLLRRKQARGWHNLIVDRAVVEALLDDNDWYDLRMPRERVEAGGFSRIVRLEKVAFELLARYAEVFWTKRRRAWEYDRIEVGTLDERDPNNIREYHLSVDAKESELIEDVRRMAAGVQSKDIPGLVRLAPPEHAYRPLLYADEKCRVSVQPAPLNSDERRVVEALVSTARDRAPCLLGRQVFLIRNLTRGRGVSFFDDYAYYPDFIVWLVNDEDQHVLFLDSKGLARYGGREKKKVRLHTEIRTIEAKVRESDPGLFLHSYVLSATRPEDIGEERLQRKDWEREGVYFLSDTGYLRRLIAHALGSR